ncbi:MAG: GrpB family protein [Anaerolineae bacterium]|jgi:GrpB-like predicted nucleotidyltransferase (UPF0157 family)|nr:GrpB family protein [Anaerolineae bacterium]
MADYDPNEPFELAAYNPEWPKIFERENELLAGALGDHAIEIEHVGSTSVPGLRAKPIIDILLAVEAFAPLDEYKRLLEPLGYHHQSHDADDERLFFWKGIPRTHHLHIVEYVTWEHQRHLLFRDYLRSHDEIARLYEEIKRQLTSAFRGNRPAYTKGKTAFIKSIMARAVEEATNPELRRLMDEGEHFTPPDQGQSPS